jgi:hypothetical protein
MQPAQETTQDREGRKKGTQSLSGKRNSPFGRYQRHRLLNTGAIMKVRELLDKPEKWTKGWWARDSKGRMVIFDTTAVSWCLVGAIEECYSYSERRAIDLKVQEALLVSRIDIWNDAPERTFEDIKDLVEKLDI